MTTLAVRRTGPLALIEDYRQPGLADWASSSGRGRFAVAQSAPTGWSQPGDPATPSRSHSADSPQGVRGAVTWQSRWTGADTDRR